MWGRWWLFQFLHWVEQKLVNSGVCLVCNLVFRVPLRVPSMFRKMLVSKRNQSSNKIINSINYSFVREWNEIESTKQAHKFILKHNKHDMLRWMVSQLLHKGLHYELQPSIFIHGKNSFIFEKNNDPCYTNALIKENKHNLSSLFPLARPPPFFPHFPPHFQQIYIYT